MTVSTPTSLLSLLVTTPVAEALSMITVQQAPITGQEAYYFADRLYKQRAGCETTFFGGARELARLVRGGTKSMNRISAAKASLAGAWNDLSPPLRTDAQIAAAAALFRTGMKKLPASENREDFLGVIATKSDGWEKFEDEEAGIVRAINPEGPLGTVALLKWAKVIAKERQRYPDQGSSQFANALHLRALTSLGDRDFLDAAQLFFLSALAFSGEWNVKKNRKRTADDRAEVARRLDQAADALAEVSPRRPLDVYTEDIIGLRKTAVLLAVPEEKAYLLSKAQRAIADSLKPSPEIGYTSTVLLKSALYYLDAAANRNNTDSDSWQEAQKILDGARRLLQEAELLPR